jgi:hypothetical protein
MLYHFRNLSMDQRFLIVFFLMSFCLSFLSGYVFFRYGQIELCKDPMEIVNLQDDLSG